MWSYRTVSREEFEERKAFAAKIMRELGCEAVNIELPYERETTAYGAGFEETHFSKQPIYKFNDGYYRIDEVLFPEKPFIVLEFAETEEEVKRNAMEDCDPFPYDLSDEDIIKEIRYSLGLEPVCI